MKKILVIYYSQTGQTLQLLSSLMLKYNAEFSIDYQQIKLKEEFPFPWKIQSFFRIFPRCYSAGLPEIANSDFRISDYDYIFIAGPVWFLSPALPVQAFINSAWARELEYKNVFIILSCRNLWYSALNYLLEKLKLLSANYLGSLVLCEKSPLWASFVTTPRWLLTGNKQPFLFFPEAGIGQKEFNSLKKLELPFLQAGNSSLFNYKNLDRISLKVMNKIGHIFFKFWASVINKISPNPSLVQDLLLLTFRINLVAVILILLPLSKVIEFTFKRFNNDFKTSLY